MLVLPTPNIACKSKQKLPVKKERFKEKGVPINYSNDYLDIDYLQKHRTLLFFFLQHH